MEMRTRKATVRLTEEELARLKEAARRADEMEMPREN